ncbi:hypothetical protein B0H13DRAFT_360432 [Mycena leptocephala]|nr:hypothetical protein B0H13DRAFT_360432 [Mycena leptocephala]
MSTENGDALPLPPDRYNLPSVLHELRKIARKIGNPKLLQHWDDTERHPERHRCLARAIRSVIQLTLQKRRAAGVPHSAVSVPRGHRFEQRITDGALLVAYIRTVFARGCLDRCTGILSGSSCLVRPPPAASVGAAHRSDFTVHQGFFPWARAPLLQMLGLIFDDSKELRCETVAVFKFMMRRGLVEHIYGSGHLKMYKLLKSHTGGEGFFFGIGA